MQTAAPRPLRNRQEIRSRFTARQNGACREISTTVHRRSGHCRFRRRRQCGRRTSRYSCDGGTYTFSLSAVSNNKVKLVDGAGNTTVLKRARTGSGERFTGGDYDLSMKGASAMISIAGGAELTDCSLVETSSARPAAATNYTCEDGGYSFSLAPLSGGRVKFTDGAGNSATPKAAGSASGERWVGRKALQPYRLHDKLAAGQRSPRQSMAIGAQSLAAQVAPGKTNPTQCPEKRQQTCRGQVAKASGPAVVERVGFEPT